MDAEQQKLTIGTYSTSNITSSYIIRLGSKGLCGRYGIYERQMGLSNVKVERCYDTVIYCNTDSAFATCSEVLADVGNLKMLTAGMIDFVVESQLPTAANGYTWYRKYKSGRVEQGGQMTVPAIQQNTTASVYVTLPIEMSQLL